MAEPIRVAVAGAAGRMGSTVCAAVEAADGLELSGRADPALETSLDDVLAGADVLDGAAGAGGNVVVVASQEPVDRTALAERLAGRVPDWRLLDGPGLDDWVGDAMVLTDDHAPVDQLLTPHAGTGGAR